MISAQVCSGLVTIEGHWKQRSNRERAGGMLTARVSTRAITREPNVTISCLRCCFLRMWPCIQHHTSTSSSFTFCTNCQRASQRSSSVCSSSSPGSSPVRGRVWGIAQISKSYTAVKISYSIFIIFYSIFHFCTVFFFFSMPEPHEQNKLW